jgi:hypothetical protein
VTTTRDLHNRAMQLFESALLARRDSDETRMTSLLSEALKMESLAADSIAANTSLEPTRSILHRSAASIASQIGDFATAKRYAETGLQGNSPDEIKEELASVYDQALTLESEMKDYRLQAPRGLTHVQKVIRRFTRSAPVDIGALAEALGLKVRQGKLGTNSGEIFRDIRRGGFSGYCIRVNADHPQVRKRFTVAHELAHFLRHRDRFTNRLVDDRMYRSGLGKTVEAEANRLAADLLMPRTLLSEFRGAGINTPEELAAKFDVSLEAMRLRLGIK